MEPYVWRVPVLLGIAAVSGLTLFAASVAAHHVTRRRPTPGVRSGAVIVLVLLGVGAALGLRAVAQQIARSLDVDPIYLVPGPLGHLGPVLFAAYAFVVGNWLLRGHWTGRRALLFYVWLLAFTVANVVNRCQPGWCETIGLPLPWRSWSDVNITMNGLDVSAMQAGIGAKVGGAVNLLIFAAVATAITRGGTRWMVSRSSSPPAAGP